MDLQTRRHSPYIHKHLGLDAAICPHCLNIVQIKMKADVNIAFADSMNANDRAFIYAKPYVNLTCPKCGIHDRQILCPKALIKACSLLIQKGYNIKEIIEDHEILDPKTGDRIVLGASIAITNIDASAFYSLPKSWEISRRTLKSAPMYRIINSDKSIPIEERIIDLEKWITSLPQREDEVQ